MAAWSYIRLPVGQLRITAGARITTVFLWTISAD